MNSQRFPKTFGAWSIWRHRSTANELSRFPKSFGIWSSWRHRSTASELTLKTSQNIWNLVQLKTQINSKWAHSQDFPKHLEPGPVEDIDQQQMNSLSRFPKTFEAWSSWRHRSTANELNLKISQNIWSLVQLKTQINSKWAHSQDFPKHLKPSAVGDTDQQQMSSLSRFPKTFEAQSSWRHRSTANFIQIAQQIP
jgi:phenylacetate-coenzyme A ligase PaaK-like adenylate-forming protein